MTHLVHSVFWDLYCAAPERRETCDHSSEAKAFHDYVSSAHENNCCSNHFHLFYKDDEKVVKIMIFQLVGYCMIIFIYLLRCQNIRIPEYLPALNMDNLNNYNSIVYFFKQSHTSSKYSGWFVCFFVPVSLCAFPLHSVTIRHLTLTVGRMMCPTMSFIGFWENNADVSMFWVRPVECSLKHVTLWDAARAVRMMCLLRVQHRFLGVHAAGFLTKNST